MEKLDLERVKAGLFLPEGYLHEPRQTIADWIDHDRAHCLL